MDHGEREHALRSHGRQDDMHTELLRASLDSARDATKALFLLNGGASIALLGFLASTFSEDFTLDEANVYRAIMRSLLFFAGGALAAVFTSALAYLVNSLYAGANAHAQRIWAWPYIEETTKSRRCQFWALGLNSLAIGTGAVSLIAFGAGLVSLASFI